MAERALKASEVHLRLYVAGNAPNSILAVANAKAICDEHYTLGYKLEIVDLMEHPLRALKDGIVVTPTLVRIRPAPNRKVIGTLSDKNRVLLALGGI
ncbi:MAG: circadian clock protein KaiB [Gemmatimonadaceae bacterium]|jgi:circadian clock protein KaiB|nr:circadian clock protein KaiB [Gemmatimonadaceae bacterium]